MHLSLFSFETEEEGFALSTRIEQRKSSFFFFLVVFFIVTYQKKKQEMKSIY